MKIYTSYFARLKELQGKGFHTLSISVRPPDFYGGSAMPYFAPRIDMLRLPKEQYAIEFHKILNSLNPKTVRESFEMIQRYTNKDIVLLCFEKNPEDCHRSMVAEWLKKQFGWEVHEYEPIAKTEKVKSKTNYEQKSLF